MSDSDKSNDRIDLFSEYIRDRLVDKPTSPDTDCWDKIDARLRKKRAISPVLYGLVIAASIIVAVFILNITGSEDEYYAQNEMAVMEAKGEDKMLQEEKSSQEKDGDIFLDNTHKEIIAKARQEEVEPLDRSTNNQKPATSHDNKNHFSSPENNTDNVLSEENMADISVENKEDDFSKEKEKKTPDVTDVKNVSKEQPSVQRETDKQQYKGFDNMLAYNTSSSKRKKDRQLSAEFGTVGGTGSFINTSKDDLASDVPQKAPSDFNKNPEYQDIQGNENGYLDLPGIENGGKEGNDMPPLSGQENEKDLDKLHSHNNNKISDIRPSIPISFGVTVRKNINRTIGIETGLVYTFLSTDMTIIDGSRSEVTLQLHYLGVPANLIVNIFDKRRWNIYMSAGGMVEKGLVAVSRSKNYYVYKNSEITKNSSVSGLQWSLNGGIGLSYGIYKDLNLYVEPGFSYYFDNDQPISKRTEDPFSFNLKLGLRYDF